MTQSFGQAPNTESDSWDPPRRQFLIPKFTTHDPEALGTLEDAVQRTRLMDAGIRQLKRFEWNAPVSQVSRRNFLQVAAACAAGIALGNLTGCATMSGGMDGYTGTFEYKGKTYHGWQAFLLQKDLIRGPDLYVNRKPPYRVMDVQGHLDQGENLGYGAVDYNVPSGTPVVPASIGHIFKHAWGNGKYVMGSHGPLERDHYFITIYLHLSEQFRLNEYVKLSHIIGLSGATMDPDVKQGPHLHVQMRKVLRRDNGPSPPGIDPFTTGIDGGRPTYWDGRSGWVEPSDAVDHKKAFEAILDNMPYNLDFETLGMDMRNTLLGLRKEPLSLRQFLAHEVLEKTPTPGGPKYKYDVDHFLYGLTYTVHMYTLEVYRRNIGVSQDFLTTLPFIHPVLTDRYAKYNQGLRGVRL